MWNIHAQIKIVNVEFSRNNKKLLAKSNYFLGVASFIIIILFIHIFLELSYYSTNKKAALKISQYLQENIRVFCWSSFLIKLRT